MTEKQKYCPKCGTPHSPGATFCRKCGEKFSVKSGSSITDTIQRTADIADKAGSTLTKVESTIKSAESMAQEALSPLIIRPPVEWKVFIGDMDSEAGRKAIEGMFSRTQDKIEEGIQREASRQAEQVIEKAQGQAKEQIQQEASSRIEKILEKPLEQRPGPEQPAPPPLPASSVGCPSCGNPVTPGEKYCGSCGASSVSIPTKPEPGTPGSQKCQKCGSPMTPGKKFCGRCGAPLSTGGPKTSVCPSCGNPVTPGKKFCGSCGRKLVG